MSKSKKADPPRRFFHPQWHDYGYTEADFILGWEHVLAATADMVSVASSYPE